MTLERMIALQGAVNFRDLGGYETADGRHTRWRVLFRADGLGELTPDDYAILRELDIRTVVDLRSAGELENGRFDVDSHPVAFHHFPFMETLPHPEVFERAPGLLAERYKEMLDDAGPQIVGALRALSAPDARPAVFHCTAGKDRTGILSALVLLLVGVPEATVVHDYALSGEAMARLREKIIAKYPDSREVIETLEETFSANPDHMVGLLRHMHEHYGTVEDYVRAKGLDPSVIVRLRDELLEPAS
ncbi:MAG TPA: tyrosine-protein phosphatase [Acidimicrobiales bacterium]|nr:tyrosine-protein phosphatase [Acidimicrobiales bacterium]